MRGGCKWLNYVQEVRPQRSVNLRYTLRPTRTCMPLQFVQVKLHQVAKKNRKKKAGGGIIDMTRMQYVKGGRV